MPNIDLVMIVKAVLLVIVIGVAIGAAYTLLSASFSGVPYAFTQAMTSEHVASTQADVTGGEWVAMIFQAIPVLRPLLTAMSGVVAVVTVWLGYLWLRRAFGS